MKNTKLMGFFTFGFLAVLLAGCFNAIPVIPTKQDDSNIESFTVDIAIGEDGRSIAGLDAARIKDGACNIVQLIVTDGEGNIVAFDEVRRERDEDDKAVLKIESLPFGETYYFLLLQGYWERDYKKETPGGDYVYTGNPPTLLAAGFKEERVTGSGKVTITMWPIVVDTVFTSASGRKTVEPALDSTGTPGEVILHPAGWDVKWTIKEGLTGNWRTGLVMAQKLINSEAGDALLLRKAETLVRDTAVTWQDSTLTGNVITRSIENTTGLGSIGNAGSVNFKLEYVPFNLTGGKTNPWTQFDEKSVFNLEGSNEPPVWIIRNGVNDEAQNDDTDFTSFNRLSSANGNGAVRYKVAAKTPAEGSALTVSDGVFEGPWTSTTPKISFTTGGYTGTAEVYYTVVEAGKGPPDYSAYGPLLAEVGPGNQTPEITVPGAKGYYDVYVIVYKDGEVSAPLIIKTVPTTFTLRIIRIDTSLDQVQGLVLDPVTVERERDLGYSETIYRTGHTNKQWAVGLGYNPTYDDGGAKRFRQLYPEDRYPLYTFSNAAGNSQLLSKSSKWGDVEIPKTDGSIVGYNVFFIEKDRYVRGYAKPATSTLKEDQFFFYLRLDVLQEFLLPMGTATDNGSKEVDPSNTEYKEVIPIGYDTLANQSSIMKSLGVGNIPNHDVDDLKR
jgi:hypothetical protein